MIDIIEKRIEILIGLLNEYLSNSENLLSIVSAISLIRKAMNTNNKLMICGNGGSAADAQHIAGEFICRFYKNRKPLPAIALTTDSSILTAISNDYSYGEVFSRQVSALGKLGDVLFGISTSGNSRNVLEAFKVAQKIGIQTILLTGANNGEILKYSDIVMKIPSTDTPRIQEIHLLIEHIICEVIESDIKEKN